METIRFIKVISVVLLLIRFNSCKGQNKQEKKFEPDVKITVNKEFDKANNMMRYDSSYSYSYSSTGSFPPDSVFSKLSWPKINNFGFSSFEDYPHFQRDSLLDFFNSSFLNERLFKDFDYFNSLHLRNLQELKDKRSSEQKNNPNR